MKKVLAKKLKIGQIVSDTKERDKVKFKVEKRIGRSILLKPIGNAKEYEQLKDRENGCVWFDNESDGGWFIEQDLVGAPKFPQLPLYKSTREYVNHYNAIIDKMGFPTLNEEQYKSCYATVSRESGEEIKIVLHFDGKLIYLPIGGTEHYKTQIELARKLKNYELN